MKIDRLLSIIIFLLDRNLVSAREMAERFEVTQRTIQRDMDSIGLAGIPVYSVQGPCGGYGILESFKMDRRLVSPEDLFFIITSLRGISSSLDDDERIEGTLAKIRGLLPSRTDGNVLTEMNEKLNIDFSMLGGDPRQRGSFRRIRDAVDAGHLIRFRYTSSRMETVERTVEPMTVAFRWRSWYLYGWCRLREDYRLFRISRMKDIDVLDEVFPRRDLRFADFIEEQDTRGAAAGIDVLLKFRPEMRNLAEEFHETVENLDDGSLIARFRMPEDGWLYGYILSWGEYVEVLEPRSLRDTMAGTAEQIRNLYLRKK